MSTFLGSIDTIKVNLLPVFVYLGTAGMLNFKSVYATLNLLGLIVSIDCYFVRSRTFSAVIPIFLQLNMNELCMSIAKCSYYSGITNYCLYELTRWRRFNIYNECVVFNDKGVVLVKRTWGANFAGSGKQPFVPSLSKREPEY